jgi:general secretion pathway protein D
VQLDAVVIRPGGEVTNLETDFFPVSRATIIRMLGAAGAKSSPTAASSDPFAASSGGGAAAASSGETEGVQNFLQQAGVNFDGTPGASLVYDGSELIVTHTSRSLSRIRNILNRYSNIRQVEIEAKFIDVDEGVLEEAGIDWLVNGSGDTYQTANRTVADAFSPSIGSNNGQIISPDLGTPITTRTIRLRSPVPWTWVGEPARLA